MTSPRAQTLTRPADTREGRRDHQDLWDQAACISVGTEIFYPESQNPAAYNDARSVCAGCPIAAMCLEKAMNDEGTVGPDTRHGMWGGLTPTERANLARRQGRPRKPRTPPPCGTDAAARAHRRRGEKPCEPCARAALVAHQERAERRQRATA